MLCKIDHNMNMVTDSYLNMAKQASSDTARISVGKQARRITKITEHLRGFLDSDQSYNVGVLSEIVK